MEDYISRSLKSILIDKILKYIEVIIVNDGSKDNTLEIAKQFEIQYPDSIIVVDKENGNYGSTINKAIDIATGKYIKTLDSDDWYDSESFIEFIKELEYCNEDLIINGYSYYFENEKKRIPAFTYKEKHWNKTFNIIEKNLYQLKLDYQLNMPAMTFKTSIIREANFKLQEKTYYTDTEYVYYPFNNTRTIKLLPIDLYIYYIGRSEQSVSPENLLKNFDSKYRIIRKMIFNYIESPKNQFLKNKKYMLIKNASGFYNYIYISDKYRDEINEIENIIKSKDPSLYNEIGENVQIYGIKYVKLHREGYDNIYIKERINNAKKIHNSYPYRILNKLKRIIQEI